MVATSAAQPTVDVVAGSTAALFRIISAGSPSLPQKDLASSAWVITLDKGAGSKESSTFDLKVRITGEWWCCVASHTMQYTGNQSSYASLTTNYFPRLRIEVFSQCPFECFAVVNVFGWR
jgi:hypothetical protein